MDRTGWQVWTRLRLCGFFLGSGVKRAALWGGFRAGCFSSIYWAHFSIYASRSFFFFFCFRRIYCHSALPYRPLHMASPYHVGSGSYETSLTEPPAKRMAPPMDFGDLRQHPDNTSSPAPHYGVPSSSGVSRDASAPINAQANQYMAGRQGSRDISAQSDPSSYSYALANGSGANAISSPFTVLQHPAFADIGSRDSSSESNNGSRLKAEENGSQRFTPQSNYTGTGSNASQDGSERPLAPTELLPPSTYAQDAVPMVGQHVPFAQMAQVPIAPNTFSNYAIPNQYHAYSNHMYPHMHNMSHGGQIPGADLHSNGSVSPPPPGQGFSMPLRRPEFVAPHRNMLMPRRHSIAVPSPGHHFGLWPAQASSSDGSSDWPLTSRQANGMMDETGSNVGADDEDSDGGEGSAVMVSLRPKDMPPGGPVIDGKYITLLVGPGEHQVKDFNILPINVLRINYDSKSSDYIVVHLLCDVKMKRTTRDIFMTAVSAHHLTHDNKRAVLPALKISQQMLRGRTKGFLFQLRYTLVVDGRELEALHSEPFYLWSNVSQRSFPRHEREAYAMETQDINTRKRRRK